MRGARTLVDALNDTADTQLTEFSEHMHTNDPEHLAHLLLAACHLELEAGKVGASA